MGNRLSAATIDLANPALVYGAVWVGGLALSFIRTPFWIQPAAPILIAVMVTVASFFVWDRLLGALSLQVVSGAPSSARPDLVLLHRFVRGLLPIWTGGFALNVIASGGLPLIWRFTGDPRTYANFGVPTFSGFLMAVKLFLLSAMLQLIPLLGRRRVFAWLGIFLATTVLEINRGGLTLMMLVAAGTWLTTSRVLPIRKLKWVPLAVLAFILAFGFLAQVRGVPERVFVALAGKGSFFTKIPSGFFWVFNYWTSPIQNLYFAYETLTPSYQPSYTLQLVVPTVLRDMLGTVDYPIPLLAPAMNATAFLGPLLADFGLGLSIAVFCLSQFFFVFVYRKARSEPTAYYVMLNAINIATLALSVFYLFFLSLIVLFYIFLVGIFMSFCWAARDGREGLGT